MKGSTGGRDALGDSESICLVGSNARSFSGAIHFSFCQERLGPRLEMERYEENRRVA